MLGQNNQTFTMGRCRKARDGASSRDVLVFNAFLFLLRSRPETMT
jgi:hypothetical protein